MSEGEIAEPLRMVGTSGTRSSIEEPAPSRRWFQTGGAADFHVEDQGET